MKPNEEAPNEPMRRVTAALRAAGGLQAPDEAHLLARAAIEAMSPSGHVCEECGKPIEWCNAEAMVDVLERELEKARRRPEARLDAEGVEAALRRLLKANDDVQAALGGIGDAEDSRALAAAQRRQTEAEIAAKVVLSADPRYSTRDAALEEAALWHDAEITRLDYLLVGAAPIDSETHRTIYGDLVRAMGIHAQAAEAIRSMCLSRRPDTVETEGVGNG